MRWFCQSQRLRLEAVRAWAGSVFQDMAMNDCDGGAAAPGAGALVCVDGGAAAPGALSARAKGRLKRKYERLSYERKMLAVQRACRLLEAGWNLSEICREPDMPGRSTFSSWLIANPELQGMVEAAQAHAATLFTPRRNYHYWDEAVAAEFLARIEDGKGLRDVCAELDMPVHATVLRWMKDRPEFEAAYRRAREQQADRLFDLAWRIACEATPGEVELARLKIQTLKWRVGKLAPRVYGPTKAQEPAAAAAGGDGGAGGKQEVVFYVRSWARTPDDQVVETTGATRGMNPAQREALYEDVRTGRMSPGELAALEAQAAADDARR